MNSQHIQEGNQNRFRTFEDLEVYQLARQFRKAMYGVTRKLPSLERFELASQVRRAAVSLTNNIAEGHGRYHYLEQIKFMLNSRGSLEELMDDLNVCLDENYLPAQEVDVLKKEGWRVYQVINGYIRHLRERKVGGEMALHESSPAFGLTDDALDDILNAPLRFNGSTVQRFNGSTVQRFNGSTVQRFNDLTI